MRLHPSTFSIVARDVRNGDLGVAVQSKFPAVGALVPWAKAKVGAIATQARVNVTYGSRGLELLEQGYSASETMSSLLASDPQREAAQAGIVDSQGRVAAHTGRDCIEWAGHVTGNAYSCQGNILASSNVVEAMARTFEEHAGDLVDRLLAALVAGQSAGGDRRGQQSAAVLIVREKGGYEGTTDRYVDLRVDESPAPIDELLRVFKVFDMTMLTREDPATLVPIDERIATRMQKSLKKLGIYRGEITGVMDATSNKALDHFISVHNFENKMQVKGKIWLSILDYMEQMANHRP